MSGRTLFAVLLVVALSAPVFAGDIIAMPTGNSVAPGDFEINAIYWNRPHDTDALIGEAFFGVFDRLELDVLFADVDNADSYWQLNAYATLIKETATHPSLIAGFTNITGEDWIGGAQFAKDVMGPVGGTGLPLGHSEYDEASFFVLGSYNLAVPEEIDWQTPFVRLHLGYGDKAHGDQGFGGMQFKVHPRFGGAILNYAAMPAYMLTFQAADWLEATAGVYDGDTFYRLGGFFSW